MITSREDRVPMQLRVLMTLSKEGGQVLILDGLGTQVRTITRIPAPTSSFNWSQGHISFSRFVLCFIFPHRRNTAFGSKIYGIKAVRSLHDNFKRVDRRTCFS